MLSNCGVGEDSWEFHTSSYILQDPNPMPLLLCNICWQSYEYGHPSVLPTQILFTTLLWHFSHCITTISLHHQGSHQTMTPERPELCHIYLFLPSDLSFNMFMAKKKKSISFQYERHKSKLVHPISKVGLQGVGLGFWIWEENNILILPFWDFAFQIIWRHWFIQRIWHGMLYLSA